MPSSIGEYNGRFSIHFINIGRIAHCSWMADVTLRENESVGRNDDSAGKDLDARSSAIGAVHWHIRFDGHNGRHHLRGRSLNVSLPSRSIDVLSATICRREKYESDNDTAHGAGRT
jgi:hypothetical protein